jgi:hypothetical protein
MTIEYGNSEVTHSQRALMLAQARGALCPSNRYYSQITIPIIASGLGAYSAFSCDGSPLFLLIGCMLTGHTAELLYRWRSYDRWLNSLFFPSTLKTDEKRIRLDIEDNGLHEHQGDVVAFAVWKDVVDTILDTELLVIKLSSGQEALIPRQSLGISELNLEEIRSEIERRRKQNDRSV